MGKYSYSFFDSSTKATGFGGSSGINSDNPSPATLSLGIPIFGFVYYGGGFGVICDSVVYYFSGTSITSSERPNPSIFNFGIANGKPFF